RSPLMRCPLGGAKSQLLSLVIVAGVLTGCESYRGHMYWAWDVPAFEAGRECQSTEGGGGSVIHVYVGDWEGRPLPGVAVRLVRVADSKALTGETSSAGLFDSSVPPGEWKVAVSLKGFRTGKYGIEIPAETACT